MNNAGGSKRQYQKDSSSNSEFGRLPPHSIEAEESVLGAILLDNEAINTAVEKIQADDFYRAGHKAIFAAMTALNDKREPVDVITLSQELRSMGLLEEAGGLQKLTSLSSAVPSAANVAYYAKAVREHAMRRRLIHEATEIVNEAFNLEHELDEFLDKSEQRVLGVSEYRVKKSFAHVSEVVQESIKLVETLYDRKEPVTGCPSGFTRLDDLTAGFQPSDLVIIAARPSMGKTALALSIAQNVGLMKHEEE
ncbi:MAG: replicative DNA helicase, partial [Proteobacteria bacterium]|nr:replicative DNA helicase [Pseudomonadota bacterium]